MKPPSFAVILTGLALLLTARGNALGQVLFYDNFEQFENGTTITNEYTYSPAPGPAGAIAEITHIESTTVIMTNLAGSIRALYDCPASSVSTNYNDYTASFAPRTNPVLQITWQLRIDSVNPGTLGGALAQLPIAGNDESTVIALGDGGQIFGVTNVLSSAADLINIGSWSNWVGSVMSNQLILNYPAHTITFAINGNLVATLAMRPDLTNYVDHVTFEFEENTANGAAGNRFALGNVKVELAASAQTSSFQWAQRVASYGSWPEGEPNIGLALDTNDNCYVTGFFEGTNDFGGITLTNQSAGGSDVFVAKYNSTGALQWVQQAGGTYTNYGRAVGADNHGNVYVTGGYHGPANFSGLNLPAISGEGFFLAKYDNAGTVEWVQSSTGGSDDVYGIGLAVDGAGNSYALAVVDHLSGQMTNILFGSTNLIIPSGYNTSTILVKYDNAGNAEWARLMGSAGSGSAKYDEAYATKVVVSAAGNVYVRGTFSPTLTIGTSNLVARPNSELNMFLAKFDSSGTLAWVQQATGGNTGEGGVAVDPVENAYVTGAFETNLSRGEQNRRSIVVSKTGMVL
ncbi:MAG TPA: SBBP repeat-containing protein [Verrucomicrobiae bacterium]|nr:SBBP repeat-containing protein [Verrucomicrobiae bacterium]